jgi:hypothetical protein
MQFWILLGLLVLAEVFVFSRIPFALADGSVPLNPLGWFGYSEYLAVRVDRENAPAAFWAIVAVLMLAALIFGLFIVMLVRSAG